MPLTLEDFSGQTIQCIESKMPGIFDGVLEDYWESSETIYFFYHI